VEKVLERRIDVLIVAMFAIVFGITMWLSFMQGRETGSFDVEVIYGRAAVLIYFLFLLMKQVWKRGRGISYL
jgi:hypothetical protein